MARGFSFGDANRHLSAGMRKNRERKAASSQCFLLTISRKNLKRVNQNNWENQANVRGKLVNTWKRIYVSKALFLTHIKQIKM